MGATAGEPVSGSDDGADGAMKPDGKQDGDGGGRSSNERPVWITDDLVADTLRVWRACTNKPLTEPEAVSLILQFGNLLDATGLMRQREANHEPVHGAGSGEQS